MLIPEKILAQCHAHGIKDYPEETCGFIVGDKDDPESLETVYPMRNIMSEMHEEDPKKFTRTGKDGYMIDPLEQLRLERALRKKGKKIKVVYHSHPDVGAYFSEKDKEEALWNGNARYPGITFLVCATNNGIPGDAILADFNPAKGDFDITHIPQQSFLKSTGTLGGKFGITGILPTLNFIHEWQRGEREITNGYFRIVGTRQVKNLQKKLCVCHQVKNVLTYCSSRAALLELLSYFKNSLQKTELHLGTNKKSFLNHSINALGFSLVTFNLKNLTTSESFSSKKSAILLISTERPKNFFFENKEWLDKLKSLKIPLVIFCEYSSNQSDSFPKLNWAERHIYFVTGFRFKKNKTKKNFGGAIMSNNDRQMSELAQFLKQRGTILSARNAEIISDFYPKEKDKSQKKHDQPESSKKFILHPEKKAVKRLLCEWEHASDALFFPSGMAAIMAVISVLRTKQRPQVIVIGLLYSETYSLLMGANHSSLFETVFLGLSDLKKLPNLLSNRTAMVITETITNPLCDVPDLEIIGKLTNDRGIPFVVDNTLATPLNCQPIDWGADYVIHSTTKFLNGANDHAGGVVLIKNSVNAKRLKNLHRNWKLDISELEIAVLYKRLGNFKERMERFNSNSISVADFLEDHPSVSKVYYACNPNNISRNNNYTKLISGNGGVISFVLKNDTEKNLGLFYDNNFSYINKAPTLGSDQTLICPYTLLTHYHYTDEELREIELPRNLIRVATGCELKIENILIDLNSALSRTI